MGEDTYWTRRLLIDALIHAMPESPTICPVCKWPTGGSGDYKCLCQRDD